MNNYLNTIIYHQHYNHTISKYQKTHILVTLINPNTTKATSHSILNLYFLYRKIPASRTSLRKDFLHPHLIKIYDN